jgi:hypothetical protein
MPIFIDQEGGTCLMRSACIKRNSKVQRGDNKTLLRLRLLKEVCFDCKWCQQKPTAISVVTTTRYTRIGAARRSENLLSGAVGMAFFAKIVTKHSQSVDLLLS